MDTATYRQHEADRMDEKDLQWKVKELCDALGLKHYHPHDSRRSEPGFPDSVIVGRDGVMFRELKSESGRLSQPQREWLDALVKAGQDACVWRPSDLLAGHIQTELEGLR